MSVLDQTIGVDGGINTDVSEYLPSPGNLSVIGMHGNKRGALTKWSGSQTFSVPVTGRITGLVQAKLGTTIYYFAMAGGSIYLLNEFTVSQLVTGQQVSFYDARVVGSSLFLVSAGNPNKKILQDLTVQNVGIDLPGTAPTVADGGAGVLTGTFSYKRTFKNSVTGHESNPSGKSADLTVTSKNITVGGLGGATDPQVDTQVIYRTTSTGAGIWFRLVELPISSTSYLDALTTLGEAVIEDAAVPPNARYLEYYNGMLLYTGLDSPNQSRVAVSGVLRPEAHNPDDVYDLDPEDEDIITGIKRFSSGVAVTKKKGIYFGSGPTSDAMEFVRTDVEEGALGNWGIVKFESRLAYLSQRGPFLFSGLREEFIGYKIQQLWKTLDLAAMEQSSGVYYLPLNMIMWTAKTVGQSEYDLWLCFNTKTGEWTTRQFTGSKLAVYLDAANTSKLWIGGTNGVIYTGDIGTSDNGQPIAIELVTRGIGLKQKAGKWDFDQLYSFRHVEIHYQPNGGVSLLTVSYALDNQDGPFLPMVNKDTGLSTFSVTTGNRVRFDLGGIGRLIYLKITGLSNEPLVLQGIRVEGDPLGRR